MKIRHILSFACVLLLFSLGTESQVRTKIGDGVRMKIAGFGAEKVLNNEFETAGGGGADVFADWTEFTSGASTINQDAANEYSGANCCRFDIDAVANIVFINQTITLGQNKRYTLSFWYYNSIAIKTSLFKLVDTGSNFSIDANGEWQAGSNWIIVPNALSWTKYEIEFNCHPDYTNYNMRFASDSTSSSVYLDQVQLRETPAKVFIGRLANGLYEAIGFKMPWLEGDNILEANK